MAYEFRTDSMCVLFAQSPFLLARRLTRAWRHKPQPLLLPPSVTAASGAHRRSPRGVVFSTTSAGTTYRTL